MGPELESLHSGAAFGSEDMVVSPVCKEVTYISVWFNWTKGPPRTTEERSMHVAAEGLCFSLWFPGFSGGIMFGFLGLRSSWGVGRRLEGHSNSTSLPLLNLEKNVAHPSTLLTPLSVISLSRSFSGISLKGY